MLDLRFIRENPDLVKEGARKKRIDADIDGLLALDARAREMRTRLDNLRAERNRGSEQVPRLQGEEKQKAIARMKEVSNEVKALEPEHKALEEQISALLLTVPNPPGGDVPLGETEADNAEVRRWGTPPAFDFTPKDHVELGEALDLIDIPRGVKLAGSRSYILKNEGALLHWAVLRLAMDRMVGKGFVPMVVPVLVNEAPMVGTGYFPTGRDQAYHVEKDEAFLVGTAEVSLTSYHCEEMLNEADLPKKFVGLSDCFRREAGTYGKDTRGLYRIHLFEKVEQVVVCANDEAESRRWHDAILANAEEVVQALGIPYRVVAVCTGDLGQGQVRKHDIESWMPSRNGYGETHSCSTFHEFQARRLNVRYRDPEGRVRFVHTLNNTVIASPRILIPILENNQRADGGVVIPEVLRPYLGGKEVIEPR
ncbi:MAG: serine--tRNA ligase [Candidatus Handelsmanbacteria bacterium RIFCSPLOWO2_12_FULL_64_10]|uniref:Serine--tRNA ligase n=1 Tax=Handelsmanbacteria sp. (strain RIFCSPLOWO2_12_FULL_64_10) TaxID=1817868 RepID=A0A1F6CSX9_HANXR|nr:MAG: serine--tRNA ligase [Candidatus Handelsmanbacteria bacterium RIFCSPLOWO2_12_FULL_64_10]